MLGFRCCAQKDSKMVPARPNACSTSCSSEHRGGLLMQPDASHASAFSAFRVYTDNYGLPAGQSLEDAVISVSPPS